MWLTEIIGHRCLSPNKVEKTSIRGLFNILLKFFAEGGRIRVISF